MDTPEKPLDQILRALQERAKELDCLYHVEEVLRQSDSPPEEAFRAIIRAIPPGFQHPTICRSRILYQGEHRFPDFRESPWCLSSPIVVQREPVGTLEVYYLEKVPDEDEGPFLKEERRLIDAIADRIGHFLEHQKLRQAFNEIQSAPAQGPGARARWWVILDFLKRTDPALLMRISRKMLNHLCWSDIAEAAALLQELAQEEHDLAADAAYDENRPSAPRWTGDRLVITDKTFTIAARHLSEEEILSNLQRWIKEDKSRFLIQTMGNPDSSIDEITDAIRRYHHMSPGGVELSPAVEKGLRVSLIERLFTDQLDFVNIAKNYVTVDDFHDLAGRTIHPPKSRGKLGGKSAGLFLATQVLKRSSRYTEAFGPPKVPRTWYISSDCLLRFIQYNNLEDVHNHKYLEIEQIRQEYPHLVQVFKRSHFPPEIVKGLSMVLDEFEGRPLIVRSSSLLEDRLGAAFSGKYKSLFIANLGTKQERLARLQDAIAEVYASTFGPDPIEYRIERGLIDVQEEMGIMIQEVVGTRVGPYFLPAFSGVAFSHNEFRWSNRIRREDGLLRMVPGLGTRAVDRLKDDYPVLMAPGQPGLRVNVTPDEIARYSPRKLDVINLETGSFETVALRDLLRRCGTEYPRLRDILSLYDGTQIRRITGLLPDFEKDDLVVTFDGIAASTPFVKQIQTILEILRVAIGAPIDIEFASDGKDLHILQCRAQSLVSEERPVPIPRDIPADRILFSANRFVSNGRVPPITHIVYIDPSAYANLATLDDLREVGRAVGRLNNLLPKRQFILIGPGRWGSRGDIRLGVNVTYSDINNTAVLVEVARRKGGYLPDLSFGTHFFQDLVESSIRYLPLYPDEQGAAFNEAFFLRSDNILPQILPEYAHLADVVRVIDVAGVAPGRVLRVLMNADLDEAVGILAAPQFVPEESTERIEERDGRPENHWRWRLRFAERIAAELDPVRFGVKGFYLIGSVKNAVAGPASDIDVLIHFGGTDDQRVALERWLEGWSLALGEMNYLRTGYRTPGILDAHLLTDEDIANRTSFAVKIGAVTDPARRLPMKGEAAAS
jgi:hypothetical protein